MEASPQPAASSADANRRKSGRAVQKPARFQQDADLPVVTNGSSKRKRAERVAQDDDNALGSEPSSEEPESDPDAEEIKEKRRRVAKTSKVRAKPAAKKPKANGDAVKLAMRPMTNGIKKPAKPRKPATRKNVPQALGSDLFGVPSRYTLLMTLLTYRSRRLWL